MAKAKRAKAAPEPYWNECVEIWFSVCRENFLEEPSFDGSSPRNLKSIVKSLRERAEKSNIKWTLNQAKHRLKNFFQFALQNQWLREHWLLSNIDRQKDTIFFQIRAAINRTPTDPFE